MTSQFPLNRTLLSSTSHWMLSCFKYVVLFDKMSPIISSVQHYLIVWFHIYQVTFDLAVVLSQTRMCVTNLGELL